MKKFWSLALIILWGILPPISSVWAQDSKPMMLGDSVSIISDKAYRQTSENRFEAVGNVIILHKNESLYGETASLNMQTGDVFVQGNVRYVGPDYTLYGSELAYNYKSDLLEVKNARIVAEQNQGGFVVVADEMKRLNPTRFYAKNAEYTTCRDCPESWSIFGSEVDITLGNYIHIYHALLKIKSITLLYLPYAAFPIKKERSTGLLFPKLSLSFTRGVRYQQPFFWASSRQNDFTFTPGTLGRRGLNHEFRFRHAFGDQQWLQLDSLQARDRIYAPYKQDEEASGEHFFRHFTRLESHYAFTNNLQTHLKLLTFKDLDMVRDHDYFMQDQVVNPYLGSSGHIDWRRDYFNLSIESHFARNLVDYDALRFDPGMVQILPRLSFFTTPWNIYKGNHSLFHRLDFYSQSSYTVFKQNKLTRDNSETYLRNTHRLLSTPELEIGLLDLGPLELKSNYQVLAANYHFPYADTSFNNFPNRQVGSFDDQFKRLSQYMTSTLSFGMDRIYGLAYQEKVPLEQSDVTNNDDAMESRRFQNTIGDLPAFDEELEKDYLLKKKSAYRHSQQFDLVHHYLLDEEVHGSEKFRYQLDDARGWFDQKDVLWRNLHTLGNVENQTQISKVNSLELRWSNRVTEKSPKGNLLPEQDFQYLRDQFDYSDRAGLDLSQGLELNDRDRNFEDRLSRLYFRTYFNLGRFQFSFSEYYFYQTAAHIFNVGLTSTYDQAAFRVAVNYDSRTIPTNKTFVLSGNYTFFDLLSFRADYEFDLEITQTTSETYGIQYRPYNNCWRVELVYSKNQIEQSVSFNFLINFFQDQFQSFAGGA